MRGPDCHSWNEAVNRHSVVSRQALSAAEGFNSAKGIVPLLTTCFSRFDVRGGSVSAMDYVLTNPEVRV